MTDRDAKIKEMTDLLTIWFYLTVGSTHWPAAVSALEERINALGAAVAQS